MTDYHTHILPGIDDGSKDLSMSLEMLGTLKQQGVTRVACTPHYYPMREDPVHFLKRRDVAFSSLCTAVSVELPTLLLGAEFYYYEGISRLDCLDEFRIQGTDLLLIEMPFERWSSRWINELVSINEIKGFHVLLAHVNRYLKYTDWDMLNELADESVAFQINNEAFSGFITRHNAFKLISISSEFYLGSDAHNMTSRRPNWETVPPRIRSQL